MKIANLLLIVVFLVSQVNSSKLFRNLPLKELQVDELPEIPAVENVAKDDGGLLTMDGQHIEGFMGPEHENPVNLVEALEELEQELLDIELLGAMNEENDEEPQF